MLLARSRRGYALAKDGGPSRARWGLYLSERGRRTLALPIAWVPRPAATSVHLPRTKAHSPAPLFPSRETHQPHHRGGMALHGNGQSYRHKSEGAFLAPFIPIRAPVKRVPYTGGHQRALVLVRLISLPLVRLRVGLGRLERAGSAAGLHRGAAGVQ